MSDFNFDRLQLMLPSVTSLLFAGSALYIGCIDPCVRESHRDEKTQLVHWSSMYTHSKLAMGSLAGVSSLLGLNAYRLTKQPLWLYGSAAVFAILPFTYFAIMGINKDLKQIQSHSKYGTDMSKSVASKLAEWVWRHKIRALLALLAAGFYIAADSNKTVVIRPNVP